MALSKITAKGNALSSNGNLLVNATSIKNGDGYDATRKFVTIAADTGVVDRGAFLELVGTAGGSDNYWLGQVGFYSSGNPNAHSRIFSYTEGGANSGAIFLATNQSANTSSPTNRWKVSSGGNFVALTSDVGIQFAKTGATNAVLNDYQTGTFTPAIYQNGTQITSPTSAFGNYTKIGNLVWVNWYFYKSSGAASTGSGYQLRSLPFPTDGSYYFLPSGYTGVNSADYFSGNGTNPGRWQLNSGTTADLYGAGGQINWTSGYLEFGASGVYKTNA